MGLLLALLFQIDDIDDLVRRLGSESIEEREEASAALREAGDRAVPAIKEALRSHDAEVRARAAELMDWASARAPVDSIRLTLRNARDAGRGRVAVKLCVTNSAPVPIILNREGLDIYGLASRLKMQDEFFRLAPGETWEQTFEDQVHDEFASLVPLYSYSRGEFRKRRAGEGNVSWGRAIWNLALDGSTRGEPVDVRIGSFPRVRVLRLKRVEAEGAAHYLGDRLRDWGMTIYSDRQTRCLIIRSEPTLLEEAATLIDRLEVEPRDD